MRTPGHWKNWSRCTGGKQAETATKNGGPAAGFYLLDDHLPHTIWTNSGGMTGCQSFTISECALGVKVLSTQDRNGKQSASDAAYNLAKHLMTYQLNIKSNSAPCTAAASAAASAEALLASICFNASKEYLKSTSVNRTLALGYAKILDAYNNNILACGAVPRVAPATAASVRAAAEDAVGLVTSVYPNPTNANATITFSAAKTGRVMLEVYNAIGRKISTLYDGPTTAGETCKTTLKGAELSSGTYFYRLSSGGKTKTTRFVIMK